MIRTSLRKAAAVAAAAVLAGSVAGGTHAAATDAPSDAFTLGYQVGLQAYRYGLPLVTTERTYRHQTSIDVPNGRGFGPVNELNPVRKFIDPDDRSVVAPNLDTLYAIGWLDLSEQPQVIRVPRVRGRYFVIPLMSPYTENFTNLGSVTRTAPGDYAVVGPDDADLPLPKHVTRVVSPYDRVWIIERIYADNDSAKDQKAVNKLQDRITVTGLDRFRSGKPEPVPADPDTTVEDPGMPTGMAFYDQLGDLLAQFPAPAADQPMLAQLAAIGVGPGKHPSTDPDLDPETVAGMTAAVAAGPAAVLGDAQALYAQGFARHNGYLVTATGNYGTDYVLRAVVTQVGLGALQPNQSLYPLALLDRTGQPLTGAKRYRVHIPAGALPPVTDTGFWSMTLYDNDGFIVANPIDRYAVNDRTDLAHNPDGSLDLYIQAEEPADPAQAQNWLPSPVGGFRILWRTYGTDPAAIPGILDGSGWRAPAIVPIG